MSINEERVRAYLDQEALKKLDAVRTAGDAAEARRRAEQQAAEATAAYDKAWKAALDAGWSEAELRRLGLTTQTRRRRAPKKSKGDGNDEDSPKPE